LLKVVKKLKLGNKSISLEGFRVELITCGAEPPGRRGVIPALLPHGVGDLGSVW